MKKYFFTGLVILLPLVMTFLLVSFLVDVLTQPFLGAVQSLLLDFNLPKPVLKLISEIIILILLTLFVVLIGFLANWVFLHYFVKWFDYLLHLTPFVNNIYSSTKDVVNSLFSSKTPSFSQVVFVPFPSKKSLCVGLISKDSIDIHQTESSSQVVSVFIPGTPNPTVGFLLMFPRDKLIFTDMKIDEAMKLVISCGVMLPNFSFKPKLSEVECENSSVEDK